MFISIIRSRFSGEPVNIHIWNIHEIILKAENSNEVYLPGPGIGFEDVVTYRKKQSFNSVSMIASYPNWEADHNANTFTDLHPHQAPGSPPESLDGWSFLMRKPEKDLAFLYFENQAVLPEITGFSPGKKYILQWYNALNGE